MDSVKVDLLRYSFQDDTLGLFFVNGQWVCYSLEDKKRENKVYGETCIPKGIYELGLRAEGRTHEKYTERYANKPDFHVGMIQILDVPDFEYILIHSGNTKKDTLGCPLTGDNINENITQPGFISNSRKAYERFYPLVAHPLSKGIIGHIEILEISL
jgi:hypothetical protein